MALLQIDKQAITESDAQRLIEQTLEIAMPLGIPTMHFSYDDVPPEGTGFQKFVSGYYQTIIDIFGRAPKSLDFFENSKRHLASKFDRLAFGLGLSPVEAKKKSGYFRRVANCHFHHHQAGFEEGSAYSSLHSGLSRQTDFAHKYAQNPSSYKEGDMNIVVMPKEINWGTAATQLEILQQKFYALWHEIAHGTGAGEPQADAIAAIITKCAFGNNLMINRIADDRMFDLMKAPKDVSWVKLIHYGWGMVDVNDYISALPQQTVSGLTEEQIRNLRFKRFDHLGKTVTAVCKFLFDEKAISTDPVHKTEIAMELSEGQFRNDPAARRMLERYILACKRISDGYDIPSREPENGKYFSFIDEPGF